MLNDVPLRFLVGSPDGLLVIPKIEKLVTRAFSAEGQGASGSTDTAPFQRSNIWYIRSLGRVLTGDRLQFLGVESGTHKALAVNRDNWILSYDFAEPAGSGSGSDPGSESRIESNDGIPEPRLYNPDQIPLKFIHYDGFAIIGGDGEGYFFHITEAAQQLVAIDLGEDTGLQNWDHSRPVAALARRINNKASQKIDDLDLLHSGDESASVTQSPRLEVYLPDSLKEDYKVWYEPEGVVRIFAGNDPNAHIVGVGKTADTEVTYFFAPTEGRLYKREGEQQVAEGSYNDVKRLGNVLALFGTSGNDTLSADDLVDMGSPALQQSLEPIEVTEAEPENIADDFLLYLEGQEGWDEYRVPADALGHYPRIMINPAELLTASEDSGQRLLNLEDYPAHDFTGHRYENNLILRHRINGHEIIIVSAWPALGSLDLIPPVEVQFRDGSMSLGELAAQVLVSDQRLSFPLKFGGWHRQVISLGKDQQLFIDGREVPAPTIQYDDNDLHLTFMPGQSTEAVIVLRNYRHRDYAHGDVWFAGPGQTGYALFQYDDDQACHYCLDGVQLHGLRVLTDNLALFPGFQNQTLWISERCLSWISSGDCSLVAQKREPPGYPLIPQHWLESGVNFTVPERFPWAAPQEPDQGYFPDVHLVIYGIEPARLSFAFTADGPDFLNWQAIYNGWPVRTGKINNKTDSSFGLTLAYDANNNVEHFRVFPFALGKTRIQVSHRDRMTLIYHGYHLNVTLPYPPQGYTPEARLAFQAIVGLLPGYEGAYFTDGLSYRWQLADFIASQPLTLVPLHRVSDGHWSATGNALNNIIPVNLREFGHYSVTGNDGDDLILVHGGFRSATINLQAPWHTDQRRDGSTTVDGKTLPLSQLDIRAEPIVPLPVSAVTFDVDINTGAGDDVVDISAAGNTLVRGSEGQDRVFVHHDSFADLKALRNGILFLQDIYSTEVIPVLYDPDNDQVVDSLAEGVEIYLWSYRFDPGRYIARLLPESLSEIYFADGRLVKDVGLWSLRC